MTYDNNVGLDTFKMYYLRVIKGVKVRRYLARSTDYGITWTDTQLVVVQDTLRQWESIIKKPDSVNYFMAFNKWINQKSFMNSSISTNGGFNFLNNDSVMELGEDKSFIWNAEENEFWGYVRPYNIEPSCCFGNDPPTCISHGSGVRKIALMKNGQYFANSGDWTARNIILEVDTNDYLNSASPDFRTQIYYMQVFRNGKDWWGLIGMYRVGDNGGENNPYPSFSNTLQYTVDVELVWSDDGENWCRTNNRQPFLPLHDSIKQIFAVGTVVQDSVYFYSIESTLHHSQYYTQYYCGPTNETIKNGKYFNIFLSKMSIDKLNEWRPSSVFKINCAVEGFLNTGSGKHNLRDTLTAELRNSTSPYGLAATTKSVIDSVSFLGNFNFSHVDPGNYFIAIYGRNSLETWSDSAISVCNGIDAEHNFTTSYFEAYGGNVVLKSGIYCIFSGDVNNDDAIDLSDLSIIDNDISNSVSGYVNSDLNGDGEVDIADATIADNNSYNSVSTIHP